jgi:isoquinoline 1-oxidoreductase beta subunit
MRAVVEAAARGARWGRRLPSGHGLGLALGYSFVTYAATVVEVEVDSKGQVKVVAVDMALDCGPQVNPERIRAQMEGACVMGLSLALSSEITFEAGRVQQSNFHDYEVLRLPQSPRTIRTHLVGGDPKLPPGGARGASAAQRHLCCHRQAHPVAAAARSVGQDLSSARDVPRASNQRTVCYKLNSK